MNHDSRDGQSGIGDIFKGLGKLVNVIADMAEKNVNEKKSEGELFGVDNGNGLHGKYQFSMKLGMKDSDIGGIVSDQPVEPQTEIFKEDGYTVIIAEMPEVHEESFEYNIEDGSLYLSGKGNMRNYRKSIDISGWDINPDSITVTENNGIYKIVLKHNQS